MGQNDTIISMNPKVRELLREAVQQTVNQEALKKKKLLDELGLYEMVPVPNASDGGEYTWHKGVVGYYKKVYENISEEEYKELLKYYAVESDNKTDRENIDDNGESFVKGFALVCLIMTIAIAVIIFFITVSMGTGLGGLSPAIFTGSLISCGIIVVTGIFMYSILKVFANISSKATAKYIRAARKHKITVEAITRSKSKTCPP